MINIVGINILQYANRRIRILAVIKDLQQCIKDSWKVIYDNVIDTELETKLLVYYYFFCLWRIIQIESS